MASVEETGVQVRLTFEAKALWVPEEDLWLTQETS